LLSEGVDEDRAVTIAQASAGDLDRARLLAEDPTFLDRVRLWQSVPARLDGTGSVGGGLARALIEAIELALEPLRDRQARDLAQLVDEAEQLGERGLPGRKEIVDHQNREVRRWRTDELRSGLGVLARAYRDRLAERLGDPERARDATEASARAVGLITEAAESLVRNPNETLLLEGLFIRLANLES
jgi:DNA polymerase-3 subunit delta'